MRWWLRGLVPMVIAGAAWAVWAAAPGAPEAMPDDDETGPMIKRVLVLNIDPIIEAEGGRRLHEVAGWNDPRNLAAGYISDLRRASWDQVRYQITEWQDLDLWPVKKDGFRYDDESYLSAWRKETEWHQPDAFDYHAFIAEQGLVERINNDEFDEVWVFAAPYFGMWESTMVGDGAYFVNSPPLDDIASPRPWILMGFSYERGVGEMLENFGHRTESILRHVYGSWEAEPTHAWNRFTLYDKNAPGEAACGNVHFAPNSEKDYDWGNDRLVYSSCDDWLNYPNLTGEKRLVNDAEWGRGDIRAHHIWWLQHMPHVPGRSEGKLNNWWRYIVDFERYPESRR